MLRNIDQKCWFRQSKIDGLHKFIGKRRLRHASVSRGRVKPGPTQLTQFDNELLIKFKYDLKLISAILKK